MVDELTDHAYYDLRPYTSADPLFKPFIATSFQQKAQKKNITGVELYIGKKKEPNACIISDKRVIMSEELLKLLTAQEAVAVLEHELGHIKKGTPLLDTDFVLTTSLGVSLGAGLAAFLGAEIAMAGATAAIKSIKNKGDNDEAVSRRGCLRTLGTFGAAAIGYKASAKTFKGVSSALYRNTEAKEERADDEVDDKAALRRALEKIRGWYKERGIPIVPMDNRIRRLSESNHR